MIDFHNHVLPDVDDGPKTIEESLKMLRVANQQGITEIVQTVHFQHPKMYNKNVDYSYLKSKVNSLQSLIDKEKLNIKMHLSAEVFYLPGLLEIIENPLVTIGGKKYMLIEFATNIFPVGYENEFFELQSNGITPIIAHPERYHFVQKDISILETWIDRGYIIQLDAGSIIGQFNSQTKEVALNIVNNNLFHILGSDAHNNFKRNFCLKSSYKKIIEIKSIEYLKILESNIYSILNNGEIINLDTHFISNREKNKYSYLKHKISKFIGKL